jgi:gamma-glutamylcyclotransferase (GGCT)/AIG2-like uncharacterized protein YtfP
MKDYLFAYGTLAEIHPPQKIATTVKRLKYVGDGFIFGRLYDLGEYPGAILESESRNKVFGKIFEVPPDRTVLKRLDGYEGFDPLRPARSLFIRRRTTLSRCDQPPLTGWVYEYNGSVNSQLVIKGGHYAKGSV